MITCTAVQSTAVLKFDEQPGKLVSMDIVLMGNESGFWLLNSISCLFGTSCSLGGD